uniref:Uncharacterized protein n=1 Tax=Pseudomonas phage Cygsa01 TaxID=3138529 RepID=A0AAU6W3G5_9VIRU
MNPFDPSYIEGLPERITSRIRLTEEGTSAFVDGEDGKVIGFVNSYTEALRVLVTHQSRYVAQDITHLVLKTVKDMEHKLLKSELKRNTGGVWRNTMWYDELKEELLKHVHKGDPIDVLIYCAFANWHGWDITPAECGYPVKIDPTPLLTQHQETSRALNDMHIAVATASRRLEKFGEEVHQEVLRDLQDVDSRLRKMSFSSLQLHVIPEPPIPPVRHIDLTDKV